MSSRLAKRAMDLAIGLPAFFVLLPVGIIVAVVIRATMGAPVFFISTRPGRGGQPFQMLKFRTMLDRRDASGEPLPDWERLHPVGTFFRRASLDELPQLWNIVRGDMSLVGPRPLLTSYLDRYTPEQARRHEVRPGVTGWAQVHGRQSIPFSQRLELDVWYVDHRNIALDLRILVMTAMQVLRGSGVKPGQDVRDVDDLGLNAPIEASKEPECDDQR